MCCFSSCYVNKTVQLEMSLLTCFHSKEFSLHVVVGWKNCSCRPNPVHPELRSRFSVLPDKTILGPGIQAATLCDIMQRFVKGRLEAV